MTPLLFPWQEFDPESAFFTKAVSKKKKSSNSSKKDKMSERNGAHNGEDEVFWQKSIFDSLFDSKNSI